MGEMTMAEIREVLNAHEEWEASDSLRALVEGLEAKLAAAEAKSEQRRAVLARHEYTESVETSPLQKSWACLSCNARQTLQRINGEFVSEPHKPDCAWKRAMEDA